jgi:hypothetical protein
VLAPKTTARKEALVMVYIGVDLHRKTTQVAAVDGEGALLVNRKLPTSGPEILRVFGEVAAEATPTAVAFEATFGWGWFADLVVRSPLHRRDVAELEGISTVPLTGSQRERTRRLRYGLQALLEVHFTRETKPTSRS